MTKIEDKCHFLVSRLKYENLLAQIREANIWKIRKQKLLGVEIDRILSFDEYVASLCKKGGKKLPVSTGLSN